MRLLGFAYASARVGCFDTAESRALPFVPAAHGTSDLVSFPYVVVSGSQNPHPLAKCARRMGRPGGKEGTPRARSVRSAVPIQAKGALEWATVKSSFLVGVHFFIQLATLVTLPVVRSLSPAFAGVRDDDRE